MKTLTLTLLLLTTFGSIAQQEYDGEDTESGNFFFGINLGAYQANHKTAVIYNGNVSTYGVNYFFNNTFLKPEFDTYFKYNYRVSGFADPKLMKYRPAFNIGGHAGIKLSSSVSLYADINFIKLKVEDYFSVEIDNPNDPKLAGQAQIELIPIFGEESRTNLNIGIQTNFYDEGPLKAYFNFFGNVNNSKLEKNYFVINGKTYTITHNAQPNGSINGQVNLQQTIPPGGVGFGGGAGIGAKYKFNDKFTFDINYYAIYAKTKMNANLKPMGLNHALVARIIWG